jgi:hypothetical protein
MSKLVCLFNHKGGVSKTTTAFNSGWMMASKGRRVLLADFDPQCNLTGMVMGFKGVDDLAELYTTDPPNNVKDGLAPAFEAQPRGISAAKTIPVDGNDNLFFATGPYTAGRVRNNFGHRPRVERLTLGPSKPSGIDSLFS